MLNNTSSYYKNIDFKVMGLDTITSDFLNWCMQNRDNLEFIKQCNTLKKISQQSIIHHDQYGIIKEIDDMIKNKRI
jgi:hypothetical protein